MVVETAPHVVGGVQEGWKAYAVASQPLAVDEAGGDGVIMGWGGATNHAANGVGVISGYVVGWRGDDSSRMLHCGGYHPTSRPAQGHRRLINGGCFVAADVGGEP